MDAHELPGVGRTATWVAAMRAVESARADRLLDDPYAGRFVSPADEAALAAMPPGTTEFLAIRTRFFDDWARAAAGAGLRQMVLLAAGLDTRAFRLDWPAGTRLYELDLPEILAYKQRVLDAAGALARCERVTVGVDLRDPWADALTGAGFEPATPTGWLAEGLLPYLDRSGAEALLAALTQLSAAGSHTVLDFLESGAAGTSTMRTTTEVVAGMGARLRTAEGSPADRLTDLGWRTELFRVPPLGERYGRPLPPEVDPASAGAAAIVTATR